MVGIAIINYKTYKKTIECINSIRANTKTPYKIFLLDNASPNESAEMLKKEYGDANDIELIISNKNEGYARGNNICIEKMIEQKCDYGVISNNDIICKKETIDKLVSDLKQRQEYLLVGPRIELPNGDIQKSIIEKEYGKIEYLRKTTYLSNLNKRNIKKELKHIMGITDVADVFWVSGAFFAFNVENMVKIGKFDPITFLFFEEYILAQRAKKHNLLIGYNPKVEIIHDHAYTTGGGSNIEAKIIADQSEIYYWKKYKKSGWIFLFVLKVIRSMEVFYTFGKKKDWYSIKKYKKEMHKWKN